MSARNPRTTALLRVLLVGMLGLAISAVSSAGRAEAAINFSPPAGYTGPWLGSSPGYATCLQSLRQIATPGPNVGRASYPLNPYASQRIWMKLRLERLYGNQFYVVQTKAWQFQDVPYGTNAYFFEDHFENIGSAGYFRVSYEFVWSVAGNWIGGVTTNLSGGEYYVQSSGGFTFNHGCYI